MFISSMLYLALCALLLATRVHGAELEMVADFGWGARPTGVAVTTTDRIFVSFPRWFANHTAPTCAEVVNGKLVPFPSSYYNSWNSSADSNDKFINIQSVFVDHFDRLWVLDVGAAFLGNVTAGKGAAKLILVDLGTNKIQKVYPLDEIVSPNSYINDVRISVDGNHAFLTDSNLGGLRHLDLVTGKGQVHLANHPSTHSEPGFVTSVEGQPMILISGTPAAYQSDGIAVVENYVYYHACTGRTLYRIEQQLLIDPSLSDKERAAGVEVVSLSGVPDGMVLAGNDKLEGTLYMTAVEKDGIDYLTSGNRVLPLISDELLQWPDSMSVAVNSSKLYVTASQVNYAPFILHARSRRNTYQLYQVTIKK
jgi:hypothetical protein